ncbi:hypothetical protein U8C43_07320 (plasmid) [Sinorhizobium meliloti]|nr:hypothetical protein U8C30_07345 [Sinorhizobium meliloti]WQP24123.1 hypothetical protein U8C43_07320 [Sinorhizobium meliloti]
MNASDYLKRSALYRKLVYSPYREFARVYAAKMSNEGLGRRCTWRSLSLFRDLMDWHVGNGHDPQDLSEVHVDRFLEHRFKHWSPDTGDRSALRRLLSALREEGLIPAALPVERTEHEQIVDVFAAYLRQGRAISTKRPASGIPECPLSMRTMPSAYNKSPAETARKARFKWYVGTGARHSSPVGINL